MASIKFGNIIVDMKGKINGNVYSKNKGGAYSRVRVIPANPQTADQLAVRGSFTGFSQAWRGLTAVQRAGWNQAVGNFPRTNRIGDKHNLSGNALYNSLNRNLYDVGIAAISVAPTPASVGVVSVTSVTSDNSAQTVVILMGGAVPANTSVKVFATPTLSAGISSPGTRFRQIASFAPAALASQDVTTAYLAKFGTVGAVGSKIFIKLVTVNATTGQAGAEVNFDSIIVT